MSYKSYKVYTDATNSAEIFFIYSDYWLDVKKCPQWRKYDTEFHSSVVEFQFKFDAKFLCMRDKIMSKGYAINLIDR